MYNELNDEFEEYNYPDTFLNDIREKLLNIDILEEYYDIIRKCNPGLKYEKHISTYGNIIKGGYNEHYQIHFHKYESPILYNADSLNKKLVIILESPHIEDYIEQGKDSQTLNIIYSAMNLIVNAFGNNISDREIYEIIIIDPVPFQASLGKKNREITYHVWNAIWHNLEYKQRFIDFLLTLPKGSCCVNACTSLSLKKDENSQSLQKEIRDTLDEVLDYNQVTVLSTPHPITESYFNSNFSFMNILEEY